MLDLNDRLSLSTYIYKTRLKNCRQCFNNARHSKNAQNTNNSALHLKWLLLQIVSKSAHEGPRVTTSNHELTTS